MLPAIQAELPTGVEISVLNDRSISIRDAIEDVEFTLVLAGVLVIIAIYFFLRSFRGDADPGDRAADLGDRHLRRHVSAAAIRSTTSRCWR